MRTIMIAVMTSILAAGLYAAARFNDNGDGTVTDNGTVLVWQKCSRGQNATNCSGAANQLNWHEALQYCRNLPLAGKSWRLPSVNELKSIVAYSASVPAINTGNFPATQASYYWSSSTKVVYDNQAWSVNFINGIVGSINKTNYFYVRCVADGP